MLLLLYADILLDGFESGTEAWSTWQASKITDSADPYDGSSCMKVTVDQSEGWVWRDRAFTEDWGGGNVTAIRIALKASSPNVSLVLELQYKDDQGVREKRRVSITGLSTTWQVYEYPVPDGFDYYVDDKVVDPDPNYHETDPMIDAISIGIFPTSGSVDVYIDDIILVGAEASSGGGGGETGGSTGGLGPNPVSNLQAEVVEGTRYVKLTWSPPSEVSPASYRIYRDEVYITSVAGLTPVATGITSTEWTDDTLTQNDEYKLYYYVVLGEDSTGAVITGLPQSVSVRIPDITPPSVSAGASASASAVNGTTVVQIDVSEGAFQDSGSGLDHYMIYRKSGTGEYSLIAQTSTLPYSDPAGAPGTAYVYAVSAVDKSGNESPMLETSAVVVDQDSVAPTGPDSLTASPVVEGVKLTWSSASDNSAVKGYFVYRGTSPDGSGRLEIGFTSKTSFVDSSVEHGRKYYYWVRAVDYAGNTGNFYPSGDGISAVVDLVPPEAPTKISAVSFVSSCFVYVSWDGGSDDTSLSGYRIYRATEPFTSTSEATLVAELPATSHFFTDTSTSAATTYYYTVVSIDSAGNESPISSVVKVSTFTAGDRTVVMDFDEKGEAGDWSRWPSSGDTAPELTVVNVDGDKALKVVTVEGANPPEGTWIWTSKDTSSWKGKDYLEIWFKGDESNEEVTLQINYDTKNSFYLGNIPTTWTKYTIKVPYPDRTPSQISINIKRGTIYIDDVVFANYDLAPPAQILDLTAEAETGTRIKLTWSPSQDNINGEYASYYEVYRSTTPFYLPDDSLLVKKVAASDLDQESGKLVFYDAPTQENTLFYYSVVPVDADGHKGFPSPLVSATTGEDTQNPYWDSFTSDVEILESGQVSVSWTGAKDDSLVAYYRVYRRRYDISDDDWHLVGVSTEPNYIDSEAGRGGTYQYRFIAVDVFGKESSPSAATSTVYMDVKVSSGTSAVLACQNHPLSTVELPALSSNVTFEFVSLDRPGYIGYYRLRVIDLSSESVLKSFTSQLKYRLYISRNVSAVKVEFFDGVNWIEVPATVEKDEEGNSVAVFSAPLAGTFRISQAEATAEKARITGVSYPVFSPNSDGFGDSVMIYFTNPDSAQLRLQIFTPEGKKIYESDPEITGVFAWDGKDKEGNRVPAGVYIYRIVGEKFSLGGVVVVAK